MNQPFFSVIIPTLNEEKYLPKLLIALSRQTYKGFEVIVVDGKSEDKTGLVFNKFSASIPSAKLIISDRANVGHQRNLGAKDAAGQYLVFLDADCNVDETFLEEVHLAALKKKFPFATTWIRPDSDKPIDQAMIFIANLALEVIKVLGNQFSGGYSTIIKKEIFHQLGGFREDLKINEDQDFALKAQKKNIEVTILKEPQVVFSLRRYRANGILPVLRKHSLGLIYYYMKNPMIRARYTYPMGGHVHDIKKKKKADLTKLNTYIKGIRILEKKIEKLLEEKN